MSPSCLHIRSARSPLVVRLVPQRPRQQPSPESKPLRLVYLASRCNGAEAARPVKDSAATMPNQTATISSEACFEFAESFPLLLCSLVGQEHCRSLKRLRPTIAANGKAAYSNSAKMYR